MAKPEIATITKNEIPEGLNLMSFEMETADQLRVLLRNMKQFALNNYLALAKINSTGAFTLLGHATIEDFVRIELKGIISYRNAIGFLDYIQDQDDVDLLDNDSIVKLLGIYKEGKAEKKAPSKDKDKIKLLNKALESKEIAVEQQEAEIENLRIQLDDLAREKGIDPDRLLLVRSEDAMRDFIDKQKLQAVRAINSFKTLKPDELKLISYSEIKFVLANINQALAEVYKQYESFFVDEDVLSKLGE